MQKDDKRTFEVKARYVWYSPYKLRPLADVVRGKKAQDALNWLIVYKTQRARPLRKALESALANARSLANIPAEDLRIKEIRIDQGPTHRYFKPGAMGRAMTQRRRLSHISVVLESIKKEVHRGK
ncbi:MAG: 50S ribosomal protein L22 [Candidatus Babeliaceae bacterium]